MARKKGAARNASRLSPAGRQAIIAANKRRKGKSLRQLRKARIRKAESRAFHAKQTQAARSGALYHPTTRAGVPIERMREVFFARRGAMLDDGTQTWVLVPTWLSNLAHGAEYIRRKQRENWAVYVQLFAWGSSENRAYKRTYWGRTERAPDGGPSVIMQWVLERYAREFDVSVPPDDTIPVKIQIHWGRKP